MLPPRRLQVVIPTDQEMKTVLETNRLLLRPLTLNDADDLLGVFSDPETMRHYPATKGRQEMKLYTLA